MSEELLRTVLLRTSAWPANSATGDVCIKRYQRGNHVPSKNILVERPGHW